MKSKFVFIGGDSRSGGSLLARLLDYPTQFLSFPLEHEYFANRNGELFNLTNFLKERDIKSIYDKEIIQKLLKFADGKLTSKQFYDNDSLFLNKGNFENQLVKHLKNLGEHANESDIFEVIALAFFEAFYNTSLNPLLVTNHCARTFLADLDRFFQVFDKGYFIHTIREPLSLTASLKHYSYVVTKKHKQLADSNFVNMAIERWILGLWHALNNKKKYGEKYILISYETLIKNTEEVMKGLCEMLSIPFHEEFKNPTIGTELWSGNSSFGALPQKVSREGLAHYKETLSKEEIDFINEKTGVQKFDLEKFDFNEGADIYFDEINKIACEFFKNTYAQKITREYFNFLNDEMFKIQTG